ncbi:3-hydroxyacyl-[acyl-carrier-protein] dehydratase FabZ [Arenimonas soli]|uniref:3-hydroxyacyl-[acyl-carrier-protein] dehydratase FabZ n=1 Tax=Arenimonas soli TaxID=2269504 RepID=A0ABQ1HIH1_9GAMM|nr:3-hydroxyacyl-ACP dehydratase FabZ [Arenimonas soli]GGA77865.1 3-hydroxyacyl-[acyl-carrier-protein] dehydratase FabZ [Arenimonas soli]
MSEDAIKLPVDVACILHLLPHRYPFLLVDRVVELEAHKRIRAIKNVTFNEPYFQGHFPGRPVMPGVLVIEAMAQAGGLLTQLSLPRDAIGDGKLFYLVKVDNARFNRMVVPGDQLDIEVVLKRNIRNMALYEGSARVDGKVVASAEILCAEGKE